MPSDPSSRQSPGVRVIVLGSTGSIGTQTLATLEHLNALHQRGEHPRRYEVVGLAAGSNAPRLASQAERFRVGHLALASPTPGPMPGAKVLVGPSSAEQLVREVPCDLVVAAIVGTAGLDATMAALELGRDVALANKETLVAAGSLAVPLCRRSGSRLLPIDSEHSGVWQAMGTGTPPPFDAPAGVRRVVLTASGGAFRTRDLGELHSAPVEDALKHPTWSMGPKVTIDSASLMNKALEILEAHWLFGLPPDALGAVVHPQSIVHALLELADGSVIAQLGAPDMRGPIQVALGWPHRAEACVRRLDLASLGSLTFEPVDPARYPAFGLADQALRAGGTAGAVLNAANEVAVEAYLARRCAFGEIPGLVAGALRSVGCSPVRSLADVREADAQARRAVLLGLAVAGGA